MTGSRSWLAAAIVLMLVGGVAPAAAAVDDVCRSFAEHQVWFTDTQALGNVGGVGLADHIGWDTTAPTGSAAQGDGGRYVASRVGDLAFSEDSARLGPTFEGTFGGCLDTIAVDVYLSTAGPHANEVITGDFTTWLRPELVVDGRAVFNAIPTGHIVPAEEMPGDVPIYRLRLAFTGIDAVMRALPHAFAARDAEHEVRLTVTPHSVAIDDAVFLYDAADVPAGATFNVADPDASGFTAFEATTRPDPQRPASETACQLPLRSDPVGNTPCEGVRPGALTEIDGGGGCTMNFMFVGRTADGAQRRFMGTAGHCYLEHGEEQVWAPGTGPIARTATVTGVLGTVGDGTVGDAFGQLVYARHDSLRDFALIELDDGVEASPQMCYWGGPTAVDHDLRPGPVAVRHFGQGLLYGDTVPARTGVAAEWRDPDHVYFHGGALSGDSGSGVITADGGAVGTLVHLSPIQNGDGYIGVVRVKPAMDDAIAALGLVSWELVTAPLLR